MREHYLAGLDAQSPLAYFAGLGLLRVLTDKAQDRGAAAPTLTYGPSGNSLPTLRSDLSLEEIVESVLADAREQASSLPLSFAYNESKERVAADSPGAIRDLKPPPHLAGELLRECARGSRRDADLAAAFFSELIRDRQGNTKPTAFHFTAGQQTFLGLVAELRKGIGSEDVVEALLGPWMNASQLPSLNWSSGSRNYALRARDPSKEKRGSVAGANWLAVIGLTFFPIVAQGKSLITPRVQGGWKDSTFYWPIWDGWLTARAISSLLRLDPRLWTAEERNALGITQVYSSRILRSDQGGYGSFNPAAVMVPAVRDRT